MILSDRKINQFVTYLDVILIDLQNDYILVAYNIYEVLGGNLEVFQVLFC